MFVPFLPAAALAGAFANMGAMTVKVSVLTVALQVTSVMLIAVVIGSIALLLHGKRSKQS